VECFRNKVILFVFEKKRDKFGVGVGGVLSLNSLEE
jgi:hypothetical protein